MLDFPGSLETGGEKEACLTWGVGVGVGGRQSRKGERGLPAKGEGETWSLYRRSGKGEVKFHFWGYVQACKFPPPGAVDPDKAGLSLESDLPRLSGCR